MNTSFKWIAALLAVAITAASGGYWIAGRQTGGKTQISPVQRKVLYWYDPMKPDQHFDKPGKSPYMDMQLMPRYAEQTNSTASGVHIDSRIAQNLGIRLASVQRGTLHAALDADGTVTFNQRAVSILQSRTTGFVSHVYAHAPGDVIEKNEPLLDVLVPEWASVQAEYLAMLATQDPTLISAGRSRLQLLGMPQELIAQLQTTRKVNTTVTIRAPRSGMIDTLDIRDGMTLNIGTPLATIFGLQSVWIEAAIPESRAADVHVNQHVSVNLAAYANLIFKGRVLAVLPETNPQTHTLKVRVELNNPHQQLKPGMYARVHLAGGEAQPQLLVPSDAIIRTGTRTLVFVAQEEGNYVPTEITAGMEANGQTAIVTGLHEGQQVVTSGQFLLDSEANLNDVLNRMQPATSAEHTHDQTHDRIQRSSP